MTSVLPVPCPPPANDPTSPKKPAQANETTREADQPGSTAGKGTRQGKTIAKPNLPNSSTLVT